MPEIATEKNEKPVSFTTLIVAGLASGVLWGLFFGETTNWTKWIGDIYVGLLQMAILPYVALSLIANIGRLSVDLGLRLMRAGVAVLLFLWLIGLVCLAVLTQAFPVFETGSFFSASFTEQTPPPDWLNLFVPSNPFRSLTENWIPAVVVFSIGLGVALIGIAKKAAVLEPLEVIVDALGSLNKLVVKLTPIGMFGIAAHTAGTIELAQFALIQGYLLVYAACAIIVSFLVLPGIISAVTPFRFGDVVREARDPLITAFVIGNSFVVLPMMIEGVRRLQATLGPAHTGHQAEDPDYLVPLAYPFPDIGRVVGLIFLPFAAWFYGTSLDSAQIPALLGTGILGAFGKPMITVPFLLDLAELPSDIFNLFLASGIVAARFGDLMKTMHLMAFTVLVGCMLSGIMKIRLPRLLLTAAVSFAALVLATVSIRAYLSVSFEDKFSRENLVTERQMTFPLRRPGSTVSAVVRDSSQPNPVSLKAGESRIERIKSRGLIRIGYDPEKIPFAYFGQGTPETGQKTLIGFDIEMAWYLADDLQVDIEFVPIDPNNLQQQLSDNHFDVAMSAMEGTVEQAVTLPAIDPYMDVTLAVVVPDHDKKRFQSREAVRAIPNLSLAVEKGSHFAERAPKVLPDVTVVELDSAREYFEGRHEDVDGLVISAESGSAWTLRWPHYSVANPLRGRVRVPLYYLTYRDIGFEEFLQNWLTLKRADGTFDQLYDYWILGIDEFAREPRWSIIRNVLGWVD